MITACPESWKVKVTVNKKRNERSYIFCLCFVLVFLGEDKGESIERGAGEPDERAPLAEAGGE